ncbi:MAG TPA: 50S ribosomal protein L10 [Bacteroidia bacterium]|jgi:large subunit ribosomal protein L10|nr:50S ribosomal protein L10 [Bacteroidia bacterium]
MKKEEKTKVIDQLVETLNANNKIYLADCSSLTVEKVNLLRKACFDKKISIKVVKNTLLKKALERAADSRMAELIPTLKGNTALMTTEVSNAPAKVIKEFRSKGNDKPLLKGAFVEEMIFVGDNQLDALASLKSKNELIGEVIGLLQSPIRRVISALETKKEDTGAAA